MKTNRIDHALLALMAIALAVLPFYTSGYVIYVVNLLLVFVVLALGLHLVIGETGQFALSHAAFYGVGIYTAGLINNLWHPPFFVSIVAGGLLAALMGYVIGALALRMRDIYLALSTCLRRGHAVGVPELGCRHQRLQRFPHLAGHAVRLRAGVGHQGLSLRRADRRAVVVDHRAAVALAAGLGVPRRARATWRRKPWA